MRYSVSMYKSELIDLNKTKEKKPGLKGRHAELLPGCRLE